MIAMENDTFYEAFTKTVPFGARSVEYVEQYRFDKKMKRFNENKKLQEAPSDPYITRKYPKDAQQQQQEKDPLSPKLFFDAQSGNISERDYLPLLLLPDIRDPLVHQVSFALNDLISSVNCSAASKETIRKTCLALDRLADNILKSHEDYSVIFHEKSKTLHDIIESSDIDYKNLSNEILEIENLLVQHCNTRNTITNKPIQHERITTTNYQKAILQLQMSFSLLISILHNKTTNSLSPNPYVDALKDTLSSFEKASREDLVKSALKDLTVPEDVDLKPIINDIVNS